MSFIVIIPARYFSTRFPKKPLVNINGKPMIIQVLEKARESGADRVIVATDHKEIANVVKAEKGEVCMTSSTHQSGTERLAEVVEKYQLNDEVIIVNIQSDEPMIPEMVIRQIANNLLLHKVEVTTFAVPIYKKEEILSQDVVKVVMNEKSHALYFSRSPIPWNFNQLTNPRDTIHNTFFRHLGIYGYRARFIRRYANWRSSPIEKAEMLEQLRILWYGEKIHVALIQKIHGSSIDTPEDLARLQAEIC